MSKEIKSASTRPKGVLDLSEARERLPSGFDAKDPLHLLIVAGFFYLNGSSVEQIAQLLRRDSGEITGLLTGLISNPSSQTPDKDEVQQQSRIRQRRDRFLQRYYMDGWLVDDIARLEGVSSTLPNADHKALQIELGGKGLDLVKAAVAQGRLPSDAIQDFDRIEKFRRTTRGAARALGQRGYAFADVWELAGKSLSSSEIAARLGIKVGYIDTTLSYLNSVGNLSPRANRSSSVRRATQERRHRVLHHYYEQGLSASEISKLEQVGSSVVSQDFRALEKEFGGKGLALVESAVSQGKLTPSAIDNFYQFETNRRIRRKTARTAGMLRSAQG